MAVEIRELIVKTEVSTGSSGNSIVSNSADLKHLKKQVLEECKRMLLEREKKSNYKR